MKNRSTAVRWKRIAAATFAVSLLGALVPGVTGTAAQAKPGKSCDKQNNNTYTKLLECITAEGVLKHQQALQQIADANNDPNYPGTRAAGTDGYAGSVDYVKRTLEKAGWTVTLDPVDITYNFPVVLQQLTPVNAEYPSGAFTGSGFGTVQGNVIPVDLALAPPRDSTSGCEAADFAGHRLQRGRRHRPDPARHLLLRGQGQERRGRRRGGRRHHEPGQHP